MLNKISCVFVTKFYHEKPPQKFLKYLKFVKEHGPDNTESEYPIFGRKYCEYEKRADSNSTKSILATDQDWPFPTTYYKSTDSTITGFSFFPKII